MYAKGGVSLFAKTLEVYIHLYWLKFKHMIACMICGVRSTGVYWMHDAYTSFRRCYFDIGKTVPDKAWVNTRVFMIG